MFLFICNFLLWRMCQDLIVCVLWVCMSEGNVHSPIYANATQMQRFSAKQRKLPSGSLFVLLLVACHIEVKIKHITPLEKNEKVGGGISEHTD